MAELLWRRTSLSLAGTSLLLEATFEAPMLDGESRGYSDDKEYTSEGQFDASIIAFGSYAVHVHISVRF